MIPDRDRSTQMALDHARLYRSLEDRELAVQAHAEALSKSTAELIRARRLKDEFLALMSHELRTPLTAVLGITEAMAEEELYGPLTRGQREALGKVLQSGRHLLAMLSNILDLTQLEACAAPREWVPVDVNLLCLSAMQDVQVAAKQKGIRLIRTVEGGVGLRGDERQLTQILVNLLDNAVKFTPPGGTVGLEVTVDSARERIVWVVWDTGIGIGEADYDRLFQPFTQVDGRLARQYGGIGLGLTLVRRLVELHGGSVSLDSTPGQGSRFTVCLPWSDGETVIPLAAQAPPFALPTGTRPTRVLIADDHELTLTFYRDLLSDQGGQVTVARTGTEALAQVRAMRPHVVVLDIQLPEPDGLTAIRQLRANPANAGLPIIALTALAMPGDRERCLTAGANVYLAKPVGLRRLLATIAEVLAGSTMGYTDE